MFAVLLGATAASNTVFLAHSEFFFVEEERRRLLHAAGCRSCALAGRQAGALCVESVIRQKEIGEECVGDLQRKATPPAACKPITLAVHRRCRRSTKISIRHYAAVSSTDPQTVRPVLQDI